MEYKSISLDKREELLYLHLPVDIQLLLVNMIFNSLNKCPKFKINYILQKRMRHRWEINNSFKNKWIKRYYNRELSILEVESMQYNKIFISIKVIPQCSKRIYMLITVTLRNLIAINKINPFFMKYKNKRNNNFLLVLKHITEYSKVRRMEPEDNSLANWFLMEDKSLFKYLKTK